MSAISTSPSSFSTVTTFCERFSFSLKTSFSLKIKVGQYICLKASTFHSSKLVKKLLEKKNLFTFPYYEAQIKSRGFLPVNKMKETENNNQISCFFKGYSC